MKPIFEKEKLFLEEKLGTKIPKYCWRNTRNEIYINSWDKYPIIKFKVSDNALKLIKSDYRLIDESFVYYKNNDGQMRYSPILTWEDEYGLLEQSILNKYDESCERTESYIKDHNGAEFIISVSAGKDSDLTYYITKQILQKLKKEFRVILFNTTNDTAQTYLHAKKNYGAIKIYSPSKGMWKWLKEDKNYFIPSVNVRNCCSTYKEGQLKKILTPAKEYVIFLGIRKSESTDRSEYDWDINESVKSNPKLKLNVPENWHRFAPIIEWEENEEWLFILHRGILFNEMYERGYNRVGCLICPYSRPYVDLLTKKYYPLQWGNWEKILEKNYELYHIGERLHWSLEEWKNGAWKEGVSKEQKIIHLKATPERIKLLSKIKGIPENIAAKYFQKECCDCGKKLNPDEVAMNLKEVGRFENISPENHKMYCKKCLSKKMEWSTSFYKQRVMEHQYQHCALF